MVQKAPEALVGYDDDVATLIAAIIFGEAQIRINMDTLTAGGEATTYL